MRERRSGGVAFVAQRRYWSAGDARVIVEAWRRSGESQVRFAARYGVDPKRIGRWAARLTRRGDVASARVPQRPRRHGALRFHPVAVVGGQSLIDASIMASDRSIEIRLADGPAVRVPPGVTREDLEQVLEVLVVVGAHAAR
jgi:hypothetical protein